MSDLKNILQEEYKKKKLLITPQSLMLMIEGLMDNFGDLELFQEEAQTRAGEDIRNLLPILKITEDWGKLGKRDRDIIENFTARLGGEETSIAQKINALNDIIGGNDPGTSIAEILTTMMVIETLSAILREFTEPAGGFIFEGFIAGLFGGKSVQITKPEDITAATGEEVSAAGKPITDVVLAGRHYSLKLLGSKTAVAGSFQNMVNHFQEIDHVTYLDARREGDDLHFSEFDITLPTFLETFYKPFVRYQKKTTHSLTHTQLRNRINKLGDKVFRIKAAVKVGGKTVYAGDQMKTLLDLDNAELKQLGPFEVGYSEEKFSGKVKQYYGNARIFNAVQDAIESDDKDATLAALRATPAYTKPEQFMLTRDQTKRIASYRDLGTLRLGDKALQQTWLNYGERLMVTIAPVYRALNSFTNNVNSYFLAAPTKEDSRTEFGLKAIEDASILRDSTDNAVKEMDPTAE